MLTICLAATRLRGHPNIVRTGDFHSGRISPPPSDLLPKPDPDADHSSHTTPGRRHPEPDVINLADDDDDDTSSTPRTRVKSGTTKASRNGGVPEPAFEAKDAKGQAGLGSSLLSFMNTTGKLVEVQTTAVEGREARADKAQAFTIAREQYNAAKEILADPNASQEEKAAAQKIRLKFLSL